MSALAGRVALITGAAGGIGGAIARAFAAAGARLALLDRAEPALAGELGGMALAADVTCRAAVQAALARTLDAFGQLDVLVNVAGTVSFGAAETLEEAEWDRVLDVNLKGAFLCARAAWPSMRARGRGRIVALGSISGTLGTPLASAYNASKWGLTGFIKSIAEEGRAHGIFCATVLAGSTDTDMLRQTPFPAQMTTKDVAGVVRWLSADAPMAMTGSAVEVFG